MADTFQFELVSPERRLASGQAKAVRLPGADGDLMAMPDHAPLVTTLRPGMLIVETENGEEEYAVTGGFAQITADSAKVLADEALPKSEVTAEFLKAKIAKAREDHAAADGAVADDIAKLLSDLEAMGDHIGISV